MRVGDLVPKPDKQIQFRLSSYKLIPTSSGCYVLSAFNGDILYIGLSENLYSRFRQHLTNPDKTCPTKDGRAVWFNYLIYDLNNLNKLERNWINQYEATHGQLPILNKICSPVN